MASLNRLTTEYIEKEDRLRITGEDNNGELLSFWLTQRLLCRLIRFLVSAIETSPGFSATKSIAGDRTSALFNEMAQQAAQQLLTEQPPIVDLQQEKSWLVLEVDVSKAERHVKLLFKNSTDYSVDLMLDQQQLRQWLSIVVKLWQQAEWPMSVWPDWILNAKQQPSATSRPAVH